LSVNLSFLKNASVWVWASESPGSVNKKLKLCLQDLILQYGCHKNIPGNLVSRY